MSLSPLLSEKKGEYEKALDHFKTELATIRGGRAHPDLVDGVVVEAYGTPTPLKGVASISVPDSRTIQIEPWDASLTTAIEKALKISDLGMNPNVSGKMIRLIMPEMTEENRIRMTKLAKEKAEEARVAIRKVREGIRDTIIKMEKENEMTEDDRFRTQEDLDKMTREFVERVDEMVVDKEKEIMTV